MNCVFISDLHLLPSDKKSQLLSGFCQQLIAQNKTKQLFILGDLFDIWLGDDASIAPHQDTINALKALSNQCDIFVMVGNRDFLLGPQFAQQSGVCLIKEPHLITLGKQSYLLIHGDTLCSDDIAYQRFKRLIRHPVIKKIILGLNHSMRAWLGQTLSQKSKKAQANKSLAIMDANIPTTQTLMQDYPDTHLIHGHTHRQHIHKEATYTRFVLGDWSDNKGNALVIEDGQAPVWATIP